MQEIVRINEDILGACDTGSMSGRLILDYPDPTTAGSWGPPFFSFWWVDQFITDRDEKIRILKMLSSIDTFYDNLCRVHLAETGKAMYIPQRMRLAAKRTMLEAAFPSPDKIVKLATSGRALDAKHALFKYVRKDQWR